MKQKKIPVGLVVVIIILAVAFMGIFTIVSLFAGKNKPITDDKTAAKTLGGMLDKISVSNSTPRKASVSLDDETLAAELPEISDYPLSVQGNGEVDIEIFGTSEKTGSGKDGWLNDVAEQFNRQKLKTSDGRVLSVSIRPMSSGLGSDYIISKKYLPDAYTPSNELFGLLTTAQGGELDMACDCLVENCAGVLIEKKTMEQLGKQYGKVDLETVLKATTDGLLTLGYTNPQTSATGLNFLASALYQFDSSNMAGEKAAAAFKEFQGNIPYTAYTTTQMRTSASKGSFNAMLMEYQIYVNDKDLKNTYEFIPFGVAHNNPLYAVGNLSAEKKECLERFLDYAKNADSQNLAKKDGFNQSDYKAEKTDFTGIQIMQAQKIWKENKDGGKEVIAVFVTDVSGSMAGEPIESLKRSLTNSAAYISNDNYIGLVSYSNNVTVELPVDKFSLNQRAYFQGAVEDLSANGGTASYDACLVGLDMLLKAKESHPDAKLMLFLLSDGQCNTGYTLDRIKNVFTYYEIPVYTIAYGSEADTDELGKLSNINEAAQIDASSDDVIYKLKCLFNAQM